MAGVVIDNFLYNLNLGSSNIEYSNLGNQSVGYSMYGADIPVIPSGEQIEKVLCCTSYMGIMLLTKKGNLYVSGANNSYRFGQGSTSPISTYTKVSENVKDIFMSAGNSYYITTDNELYAAGYNDKYKLTSSADTYVTTYTKIAENVANVYDNTPGYSGSCMTLYYTDLEGNLYGRGNNSFGQLAANPSSYASFNSWRKIASNVRQVETDGHTLLFINTSDNLFGCGGNSSFQLGTGDYKNVTSLRNIASNVDSVKMPDDATVYLRKDGKLYAAGRSDDSRIGQNDNLDHYIYTFSLRTENVKSFNCLAKNTFCLTNDNKFIYVGNGGVTTFDQKYAISNVQDYKVTDQIIFYRNMSGEVYGKGNNTYGQQGSGDTTHVSSFRKRFENVKDYYVHGYGTYYIDNNDDLYGTGYKYALATNENVLTYTKLAENVKEVIVPSLNDNSNLNGINNLIYIDNNNDYYIGGVNSNGQLGIGTIDTTTPYPSHSVNKVNF